MSRRLVLYGVNAVLAIGGLALVAAPADVPVGKVDRPTSAAANKTPVVQTSSPKPKGASVNPFRPAAVPVVQTEPAPPQKPSLRLVGIIDGPGRTLAIVQSGEGGALIRVHRGDPIASWTVAEINRKSIVLEGGGVRSTLLLDAPVTAEAKAKEPTTEPQGQALPIGPSSIIRRIKR